MNVTEHGIGIGFSGWFVLAQYHKRTGIISICIADNGIGIKNSLLTGFQSEEIEKNIGSREDDDHKFIELALTKPVSGALNISSEIERKGVFWKKSVIPKSRKRGMGLKRVVETCKNTGIKLTICSQKGCVALNRSGVVEFKKTLDKRCFAGTLYHLSLPAKKEVNQ